MQKEQNISLQEWLPFEQILDKGFIKLKCDNYIKIIKVIPINYSLKSELEKEGILNSYKTFLKTCNFDIQIFIKSSKVDLSKQILKIKERVQEEHNLNLLKISENYINFIKELNNEKKSSSKNFYIIIKSDSNQKETKKNIAIEELNENYLKIKECLSRCGNIATDELDKQQIRQILFEIFNEKKNN